MEENPSLSCACPVLPGVIDRWELIQAEALSKELRMKQKPQRRQQLDSDLNSVLTWLRETEGDLEQLQRLQLSTDIQSIALQIQKLKVAALGLSHGARQKAAPWNAQSDERNQPWLLHTHIAVGQWLVEMDTNVSPAIPSQSVPRKAWKG